ncbi:MAG: hypothetical protein GF353_29735 [Candidatus Lokiarchaeota archaeon]|nr:hypothetical protein [Candidatus Lokiarchaeota archaeon]
MSTAKNDYLMIVVFSPDPDFPDDIFSTRIERLNMPAAVVHKIYPE